jgi:predicted ATP-grasp superfamily ATP-dependent carboligase
MRQSSSEDIHNSVLITDPGGTQGALSIVRSLGRRNVATTLLTQERLVPALFSRWHSERVYCPSSLDNLEGFMTNLLRIARSGKYITVFPMGDNSLLPISEHRDQLAPYLKLALPSHESVVKALDKSQTLKAAEEIGIPTPKTFCPRNLTEAKDISTKIQYPAVIKPRWSCVWERNGKALYSRPYYVNSASDLLSTYAKVDKNFPAPLIQEYVPGYNISVGLLFDRGEPKATCFIRVYRTIPITGGTGVLRESVAPDPTLLRYSSDLLKRLHWYGVAEVEFRVDSRDLTPKLMEVNARFWGSMNVAIQSGVDFPYLLYLLAIGKQVRPVFNYRIGVKYRWLDGDEQNLRTILKGKQRLINLEPPNKLNAVLCFLKFYEKNIHYDGFTVSDPLPFFMNEAFYINGFVNGITKHFIHRAKEGCAPSNGLSPLVTMH